MIEESIFRKKVPVFSKLLEYGFSIKNDIYCYSKEIENGLFQVQVFVDDAVSVKVIDLELNEEYTGFRVESNIGEFAGKIRNQVILLLEDVCANCFRSEYFVSKQANRISQKILEKYGDVPYFEWEKFPDFGVFKNKNNLKWYALIMNIECNKLIDKDGFFDIINLKLEKEKIVDLLSKPGFYPAYHMNKKYWISISLDDTLSDDVIFQYIMESYQLVEGKKVSKEENRWIVPANPHYYNLENAFHESSIITWKQSSHIQKGDIVYIYVGAPISAICYKCLVLETDIPYNYQNDYVKMNYIMKIQLLKAYEKDYCTFKIMKKYGVNAVRGPRFMPTRLKDFVENGD